MRFFLNIFWRKKKSIEEQLEFIAETLKKIDEKRKVNLDTEKRLIGSFLLYSCMIYFICTAAILLYVKPSKNQYWVFYFTPLIIAPFLIFYVKRFIHWFYVRRIRYVDERQKSLKLERKQLLTTVIEQETYKRANELLNKFDPTCEFRKEYEGFEGTRLVVNCDHNSDSELNKKSTSPKSAKLKESTKTMSVLDLRSKPNEQMLLQQKFQHPLEVKLPRPLLKQQRTSFDKIIDYIVGDGFDHRYALICCHCHCHNGMALAEEFEFLSFKCAYCLGFNAARKVRPDPPKIFGLLSSISTDSVKKAEDNVDNFIYPNNGPKECTLLRRVKPREQSL